MHNFSLFFQKINEPQEGERRVPLCSPLWRRLWYTFLFSSKVDPYNKLYLLKWKAKILSLFYKPPSKLSRPLN